MEPCPRQVKAPYPRPPHPRARQSIGQRTLSFNTQPFGEDGHGRSTPEQDGQVEGLEQRRRQVTTVCRAFEQPRCKRRVPPCLRDVEVAKDREVEVEQPKKGAIVAGEGEGGQQFVDRCLCWAQVPRTEAHQKESAGP